MKVLETTLLDKKKEILVVTQKAGLITPKSVEPLLNMTLEEAQKLGMSIRNRELCLLVRNNWRDTDLRLKRNAEAVDYYVIGS